MSRADGEMMVGIAQFIAETMSSHGVEAVESVMVIMVNNGNVSLGCATADPTPLVAEVIQAIRDTCTRMTGKEGETRMWRSDGATPS